jgi:hypothetical protein
MFSHTRARKDDESRSEDERAMNRVYDGEGEESGDDDAVEKSGMGERPTDKSVRKRIRSIIHDSDSDGNGHLPVPVLCLFRILKLFQCCTIFGSPLCQILSIF